MTGIGIVSLLLIVANCIISIKGFRDKNFYYSWNFDVEKILVYKQYRRLVTSGFLHTNWLHLLFNMLGIVFFGGYVEGKLGPAQYLIIYFSSLIGGDLLSLFIHRKHSDYTSVGASGGIFGIIFASIALYPGLKLGLFLLPISIPAWLFGLLFVLYSVYGVRSRKSNIGHESHLGGALIGMMVSLLFDPSALLTNYLTILVIAVPTIAFMYMIMFRPHWLLVDNYYYKQHKQFYSIDQQYNYEKNLEQKELDRLLDKIGRYGMQSLTKAEKDKLKQFSETVR